MEPMPPTINEANRNNYTNIQATEPKFENPEHQELAAMSEASIKEEWSSCQKKQGHNGFIRWTDFISDPEKYVKEHKLTPNKTRIDYITAVANMTARLEVKFVSENRPKLYTKLFEHRGKAHLFTGSGCVVYDVKVSKYPCRCIECKKIARQNDQATIKTFSVYIATATHVVYDDHEAKNMTAELHYNDDDRMYVQKLYGVSLCERSVNGDSCVVECVTCDEKLATEIKANLESCKLLYRKFPRSREPIVVIISHPHAKPKHISFGECKKSLKERDVLLSLTIFEYDATTCPGSSGAPVLLMNDACTFRGSKFVLLNTPSHSGVNSKGNNFSGTSSYPTLKRPPSERKEKSLQKGQPQKRVRLDTEADLHRHLVGCKKNPGHAKFVPVNDFKVYHLPEECQDNDLVEFVKCLADLTVRVDIKMTSTERPEFWPNTTVPYAFYDMRGSDVMRVGTGIILLIRHIEDEQQPCTCHKCHHSDTPSKAYCHIYMKTATHVVFDDIEAHDTTALLFFDRQDSPLVTLDGWRVVDCDILGDTCYCEIVTCDLELGDKLLKMTENLKDMYEKVENEYKLEKGLAIILSHPHGCPKQVSVGYVINTYRMAETYDLEDTKHSYTTCTCPGSSGAAVFILSKDATPFIEKYITHHVHSDALDSGLNKCSLAVDKFN